MAQGALQRPPILNPVVYGQAQKEAIRPPSAAMGRGKGKGEAPQNGTNSGHQPVQFLNPSRDGWAGIILRVANQWEKAIVLRLGRYRGLKGPGPFWIIPIVDSIPAMVDHRVMVTPFTAERTLTKDSVPVDVDAVLFWVV